ncbi:molybdenum transport protein [Enterobacter sp. BIGb0383]|uniref:ModD protein n=1 Tax=unclassified Enterobacter TaxID=2608935 RepID=UPI000F4A0D09|nr:MULTISPECIES: ModD protein [unclassified Enterobacter]ROP62896.1 molybdenum transport protein [Enterobacter sp. BIGb0383]ROS13057.1 molybdenum transport protein [Enterobacter sp. BIGb0359]
MIFISQAQTDAWLLEDIQGGDLTTRALGIGALPGTMGFYHRQGGCVSGIAIARQMLLSLGLKVEVQIQDGERAVAGQLLLSASGPAAALHQGWKAVQNVLEWSCGVSGYLARMLERLHAHYPAGQIACTRKLIPGTRALATQAVIAAGGMMHRGGSAETVLLFANHRRFLQPCTGWQETLALLRRQAPEKKIVVEADTPDEARAALQAAPDVLQLDKFSPDQAAEIAVIAPSLAPGCTLALTGGITLDSLESYLHCGIELFITSAPYYASPADIKVHLAPDGQGI